MLALLEIQEQTSESVDPIRCSRCCFHGSMKVSCFRDGKHISTILPPLRRKNVKRPVMVLVHWDVFGREGQHLIGTTDVVLSCYNDDERFLQIPMTHISISQIH